MLSNVARLRTGSSSPLFAIYGAALAAKLREAITTDLAKRFPGAVQTEIQLSGTTLEEMKKKDGNVTFFAQAYRARDPKTSKTHGVWFMGTLHVGFGDDQHADMSRLSNVRFINVTVKAGKASMNSTPGIAAHQ
jgi:hypothetical protein